MEDIPIAELVRRQLVLLESLHSLATMLHTDLQEVSSSITQGFQGLHATLNTLFVQKNSGNP